jgi:hypothetical protein
MTVGSSVAALPGSNATTTGPIINAPAAVGGSTLLYDRGTFNGNIFGTPADQAYRLVVSVAGSYRVTTGWNNPADVDVAKCAATNCSDAVFFAATSANPESGTLTLTPGTYYLVLNLFAGSVPGWVSIQVDHTS